MKKTSLFIALMASSIMNAHAMWSGDEDISGNSVQNNVRLEPRLSKSELNSNGDLSCNGFVISRRTALEGWADSITLVLDERELYLEGWGAIRDHGPAHSVAVLYKGLNLGILPIDQPSGDVSAYYTKEGVPGVYDMCRFSGTLNISDLDLRNFKEDEITVIGLGQSSFNVLQKVPVKQKGFVLNTAGAFIKDGITLPLRADHEGWAHPITIDLAEKSLTLFGWSAIRDHGAADSVVVFYKGLNLGILPVDQPSGDVSAHYTKKGVPGVYDRCRFSGTLNISDLDLQNFKDDEFTVIGLGQSSFNFLAKWAVIQKGQATSRPAAEETVAAPVAVEPTIAAVNEPVAPAPAPSIDVIAATQATSGPAAVEMATMAEEPPATAPSADLINEVSARISATRSLLNNFNKDSRIVVNKEDMRDVKLGLWNIKEYLENTHTYVKGGSEGIMFMLFEELVRSTKDAINNMTDFPVSPVYVELVRVKDNLKAVLEKLTIEQKAEEVVSCPIEVPAAVAKKEPFIAPERPLLERAQEGFGKLKTTLEDSKFVNNGSLTSIIGQLRNVEKLKGVNAGDEVATLRQMIANLSEVKDLNAEETMSLRVALSQANQIVDNSESNAGKEKKGSASDLNTFDLKAGLYKISSEMSAVQANENLAFILGLIQSRLKSVTGSDSDSFEENIRKLNNIKELDADQKTLEIIKSLTQYIVKKMQNNI